MLQGPQNFADTDALLAIRLDGRPEKKVKGGKRRRRGSKASEASNHPNGTGSAHRRLFQDKKPRGVGGARNAAVQKELVEKMRKQFDLEAKRKV